MINYQLAKSFNISIFLCFIRHCNLYLKEKIKKKKKLRCCLPSLLVKGHRFKFYAKKQQGPLGKLIEKSNKIAVQIGDLTKNDC